MKPKNWKRFQHFKDRKPPWIKLYRDILDDLDWHRLDGDAAKFLVQLWLLASEDEQGNLPDVDVISFRFRINPDKVRVMISKVSEWLEGHDITTISPRHQDDPLETETETKKTTYVPEFEIIWKIHRKGSKPKAAESYRRAIRKTNAVTITNALKAYVATLRPPTFTGVHLHRWLDEERWEEMNAPSATDAREHLERQLRMIHG
jgi:hypothetical protein